MLFGIDALITRAALFFCNGQFSNNTFQFAMKKIPFNLFLSRFIILFHSTRHCLFVISKAETIHITHHQQQIKRGS